MDSEDSRDDSSASESNDGGPQSPDSIKSPDGQSNRSDSRSRSRSRSSTPSSRDGSAASRRSSDSSPQSPDNEKNMKSPGSNSDRSRSSSPENNRIDSPKERGSPVLPKHGNRKTLPSNPRSPDSPDHRKSQSPRSPVGKDSAPQSPASPRQTPESPVHQSNTARSPVNQYDTPDSPPHQLDTPDSPPHQNETPDSPFQHETPESPFQQETPESPVQHETPESPVQNETPESPVQHETPDSPLQHETPDSPVQHETPDSPVHHETPDSPVQNETPDSPLQPEYPESPIQQPPSPDSPKRKPKSPLPADDANHSSRSSSPDSPVRNKSRSPRRNRSQSNDSVKSDSSYESRKSRTRSRHSSRKSRSSRSRSSSSSDSSDSSVDTPRKRNQHPNKNADTQPEEISDGDIELDQEKDQTVDNKASKKNEINISHEDLSDVSDLEDSMGDHSEDDRSNQRENKNGYEPERVSTKEEKNNTHDVKKMIETNNRSEEAEEQLDFEAEDGECEAEPPLKDKDDGEEKETVDNKKVVEEKPPEEKEELEEGEVTDEDDVRPEETEPRPVCRFFSRGQCTWGASCRFLHPGVTDKGNYTMFDLIRPVVAGEFGREERMYGKVAEPPLVETAWERGLRTAKEMLRKSTKRKEQDIDFEEKKMNLTLAQEEFDKENGYYGRVASPEPRYVRHVSAVDYPPVARAPPIDEYYPRRQIAYEPDYVHPVPRERVRPSYRELPSHRIPDYYDDKYAAADEHSSKKGRGPSKREVIVQRVPEERETRPERERPVGRGDEWQDPWMRVRSPAGGGSNRRRGRDRKRSYSSGSTYSSSRSSSNSSRSSTYRSRSITPRRRRRSRSRRSRHVSPSVIVSERKAANERAALMNPPAPKRRAPSPGMVRVSAAANPPAPLREDRHRSKLAVAAALARVKSAGRKSSKSSSGSSGSSSSDSESSDSSSSSSRAGSSPGRRPPGVDLSLVKAMDALKGSSLEKKQIKLNLKNPVGAIKKSDIAEFARKTEAAVSQAKKRPATSPPQGDSKSKKATSRREELLKQLKAVEDAIAKKRSKVN